ncbi:hypothetical protein OROGR_026744 [Orobanche gracilis]
MEFCTINLHKSIFVVLFLMILIKNEQLAKSVGFCLYLCSLSISSSQKGGNKLIMFFEL